MKQNFLIFLLYLLSFIIIKSDSIPIDFTTAGEGYSISGDVLTITSEGSYSLTGTQVNKKILVASSCTLNFNRFILSNSGSLTPIVIGENKAVEIVLSSDSTLIDSETNENNGTIYLQKGASLTISGTGTLMITPKKLMAINGTDETTLTINDKANIMIQTESTNAGGIYLRKSITCNDAKISYYGENGTNHAIDSEGDIKLIKGNYYLQSGKGKGIQSEKNLYIGEENEDNDLTLYIETSNEGIEAKGINIYSGSIEIKAGGDAINAASSGTDCDETVQCSGNCACYINIKGGMLQSTSGEDGLDANGDIFISGGMIKVFAASTGADQPIDQDGLLKITGGMIIAVGSSEMQGGVNAQTNQTAKIYKGTISSGAVITIYNSIDVEVYIFKAPKDASYIYFNYGSSFSVKSDGTQISLSDPSQNQQPDNKGPPGNQGGPGQGNQGDPNGNSPGEENSGNPGNFLKLSNILFLFGILIL